MGGEAQDRRVRRTRRRLKEALLEMLGEMRYGEITVRDLCARADVGRSTFYGHFGSKEDLLFSGFDEWLFALIETDPPAGGADLVGDAPEGEAPGGRFRFSLPLLRHMRTQRRFFRATIVGGPESRIRRKTADLLAELARRELARETPGGDEAADTRSRAEEEARLEARAHAVAGAFLAIAAWWMENPRRLSAEAVDSVLRESVRAPGV